MRIVLGVIVGILAGLGAQTLIDVATNWLYPQPLADMWDRGEVAEAMAARPAGALAAGIAGYFAGGLLGGFLARLIARRDWTVWVPAGLLAAMALVIGLSYPVPAWAWAGWFVAPLIGGFVARHVGPEVQELPREDDGTL